MPTSHRRQLVDIERRSRQGDGRHGFTYVYSTHKSNVWTMISPVVSGGRREQQLFGPTVAYEMNALGAFTANVDVLRTDRIRVRGEVFEVQAVINVMYKNKTKFVALKTKVEQPG